MALVISALIVVWPLLEIASLVWLADRVGLFAALVLVVAGFLLGLLVLKRTGLHAVRDLRATVGRGHEPGHSLIDAACFTAAGLMFIVPGPLSDLIALALMLPATRNFLLRWAARHFEGKFRHQVNVIEGTFEVINDADAAERSQKQEIIMAKRKQP